MVWIPAIILFAITFINEVLDHLCLIIGSSWRVSEALLGFPAAEIVLHTSLVRLRGCDEGAEGEEPVHKLVNGVLQVGEQENDPQRQGVVGEVVAEALEPRSEVLEVVYW